MVYGRLYGDAVKSRSQELNKKTGQVKSLFSGPVSTKQTGLGLHQDGSRVVGGPVKTVQRDPADLWQYPVLNVRVF